MTRNTVQTKPLPAEAFDMLPVISVTLTRSQVWMTQYDDRGCPGVTYPARAADVASAFNSFSSSTSLLPINTLFWHSEAGQTRIGVWMPPQVRTLSFFGGKRDKRLTVPMPGFVFVGLGKHYWIYAAQERPSKAVSRLCVAPLPNVGPDGLICQGNVKFPVCKPDTIYAAAAAFFESLFNNHLSEGKVNADGSLFNTLRTLEGKRTFPAKLLVTDRSFDRVMQGGR